MRYLGCTFNSQFLFCCLNIGLYVGRKQVAQRGEAIRVLIGFVYLELGFWVSTAQKMQRRHFDTVQFSLGRTIQVLVEVLNVIRVLAYLKLGPRERITSASCLIQVAPHGH